MAKISKMTITKAFNLPDGLVVPKNTILHFGTEGYGFFEGRKIFKSKIPAEAAIESETDVNDDMLPEGVVEGNGSEIAEAILEIINTKFPDGFTKSEFADAFGDTINDQKYAIVEMDGVYKLIIETPDGESIEIYLSLDNETYRLTGEYHVASELTQSVATEAFIGRLALQAVASGLKKTRQ